MSPFQEAMHEFVQASNECSRATQGASSFLYDAPMVEHRLASAGDRLESILSVMMREEAYKVSNPLRSYEGMR